MSPVLTASPYYLRNSPNSPDTRLPFSFVFLVSVVCQDTLILLRVSSPLPSIVDGATKCIGTFSAVKRFVLEYCDGDSPDKFKPVFEVELADKNQRLQTEVHQVNCQAKFLKFTVGSGWGDFASVHRVSVF